MINLSQGEIAAVFMRFAEGFQPDVRGQWRGPARYRGGNNRTALSVDVERGVWYDHVTGEGGDVVEFVRRADDVDFIGACKAVSEVIGRDVLDRRAVPQGPRFCDAELAEADLFRVGLTWRVERQLIEMKEQMWAALEISEAAEHSESVRRSTAFLSELLNWTKYQAAEALSDLRRRRSAVVRQCIAEAREAQLAVARAMVSTAVTEAA